MVERFLRKTTFTSVDDYQKNLEFIVPENFNFAYDVVDAWAEEEPDKLALLWTNDEGEEIRLTFAESVVWSGGSPCSPCTSWVPWPFPPPTC